MDAEAKKKEYLQKWESYRSQKSKEKMDLTKKSTSSKVTRFSGVTKLKRHSVCFENQKHMESKNRLSLAVPQTNLGQNGKMKKIPKTSPDSKDNLSKENKPNVLGKRKSLNIKNVPSRTDSNLVRRKTLDPNFKKRLPTGEPTVQKRPLADQINPKSNAVKNEKLPFQKELKTMLISTNLGTPNTLKIPSIYNKAGIAKDSSHPQEANSMKFKRRSVKFVTSEHSIKPYSHNAVKSAEEKREKINEWLRKKGKAPISNRHSSCFCEQTPNHEGPRCKRRLTKDEIMMQKKKLDEEKQTVPEYKQEKFDTPKAVNNIIVPEMAKDAEVQNQLDLVIHECTILLDAGCPVTNIMRWLKEIEERLPTAAVKSAEFWLLKARVYVINKDMDNLLEVFSNAMKHGATPMERLAHAMPQMIKDVITFTNDTNDIEMSDIPEKLAVSKEEEEEDEELDNSIEMNDEESVYSPSQSPVPMDSIFDYESDDMSYKTPVPPTTPGILRCMESSVIKFSVNKTTPFKERIDSHEDSTVIVTPVRRSARKSMGKKCYNDNVINSLNELSSADKTNLLLKANNALKDFN